MRLFSYVVARDYGFAPNPFFGRCTLATCKPAVRKAACIGDWVIGTGSKERQRQGHLVYAMRITGTVTFDEYWRGAQFECKKPHLAGSKKQAFGDNIYHRDSQGCWMQANSHHSRADGSPNRNNMRRDTGVDRVLVSDDFVYFGGSGPALPMGLDVCKRGPGHRCKFTTTVVGAFVDWVDGLDRGYIGQPFDWEGMPWVPFHETLGDATAAPPRRLRP